MPDASPAAHAASLSDAGPDIGSSTAPNTVPDPRALPAPSAVLELLKPVTWFPPMWAYLCGFVSAGRPLDGHVGPLLVGVLLAGPLVCATSQAVNDWFDRHVDAINEPDRPVPSGRIPGRWGLWIGVAWSLLSLGVAATLGPVVLGAAVLGLGFAWAYSAPPVRLKREGWGGCAATGLSYETLPWITGAAVMAGGGWPDARVLVVAALYGIGAHGIMTLNDFKAVEGDRALGIRSLPVRHGVGPAARIACAIIALAQLVVVALLAAWGAWPHALGVAALLAAQLALMPRLLADPRAGAPRYQATGIGLYVAGMLVAAFALGGLVGGPAGVGA